MTQFAPPPGQETAQHRMEDAERYNAWLLDRARRYLGHRVLDFGAGLGPFTEAIQSGRRVVALEPDAAFVEHLHMRFAGLDNVTVVEGDDTTLDRHEWIFDSIVALNVLEHIREDATTLRRFYGSLAPGGCVLVLVPAHGVLYGRIDKNVGHERRYDRRLVRERLVAAGFELVDLRYVNPIGALGWLVSSRLLRRPAVPAGPLKAYDALVPLLRPLDRLSLPFGLSVWAVGRKAR